MKNIFTTLNLFCIFINVAIKKHITDLLMNNFNVSQLINIHCDIGQLLYAVNNTFNCNIDFKCGQVDQSNL